MLWLGDMNYRIQTNAEMTGEMIKAHADNYQISTLLREDQLVQEMTKGTIFSDFTEGAIDFKPTYKYDPNTDNWDTRCIPCPDYILCVCARTCICACVYSMSQKNGSNNVPFRF